MFSIAKMTFASWSLKRLLVSLVCLLGVVMVMLATALASTYQAAQYSSQTASLAAVAQINLQTIYASKYVANKAKGTVVWTPVKGEGNALVGGSWTVKEQKKGTDLQLKINGTVDVPLPGLMKMVVTPVVRGEFEKLVEKYIDNLIAKFGGEV